MTTYKITTKLTDANRDELLMLADEGVTVEFIGETAVFTVRNEDEGDAAVNAGWLEDTLNNMDGVTGDVDAEAVTAG